MTSVLSAVRDNAEKVAAAVAECRRLGIEVRPPDVHRSGLEFTVEDDAIRFGLLAVKNVGQGAIESIIAARAGGRDASGRSPTSARASTPRLANRKVLESLAKVGALNAFGHPAQILDGLDDALAAAQAAQRDRISGQTSLFDMAADESAVPREAAPGRRGGAGPPPARLGEGAARALPVRPPARRPGGAVARVRQRVLDGPARRVARRAARGHRRRGHRARGP